MCMLVKLAPNHTHWMKKVMKIPKIFGYELRIFLYCEDNLQNTCFRSGSSIQGNIFAMKCPN